MTEDRPLPPEPDPDDIVGQVVERAATKVADAATPPPSTPYGLYGLGIAIVILVGALFFVRASDQNKLRNITKVLYQGVGCVLADLDDHRHTNQYAHEQDANFHHYEINQPDVIPLTKEQTALLKSLCSDFVRAGNVSLRQVGSELHPGGSANGGRP